jgi:DNA-binding beta-propeller fold protein YncE
MLAAYLWVGSALAAMPCASAGSGWQFEFERASTTPLSNPHDVKLSADRRHLYVSDVGGNRVVVLDAGSLDLVDAFGAEQLSGTHDVDFDADGRLYVADTHNGRVVIFEMDGTRGTAVADLSERLSGPEGVLVHPNGLVYVAGAWSNNVVAFGDGKVAYELRGLSAPHDLEIAPDGRIWLADAGNDRILLLSERLDVLAEISGPPYDFDGVRYLDVLADGTLAAADKNTHTIKFIDPAGRLLATLGTGQRGRGVGVFRTPEGVDSSGDTLWLSDSGNDRVVKYRYRR